MTWYTLYYSLLNNMLIFFTLELFVANFSKLYISSRKFKLRIIYVIILTIYALIPNIPFGIIIEIAMDIIYIYAITKQTFFNKILVLIKYNIYLYTTIIVSSIFHTFIFSKDKEIILSSDIYKTFKYLICVSLAYILLVLYVNSKRIKATQIKSSYRTHFNLIIIISVITLTFASMLLGSTIIEQENAMPIVFSLLFIVIFLCISTYSKIAETLEQEAIQKIELEKVRLEEDYYNKINTSLKSFSSIKHDFKNHLIIIDGYAEKENFLELRKYISEITNQIPQTATIQTSNHLISSILNAKYQECINNKVKFTYDVCFDIINISDYNLVVILGNLLDNAITSALKLNEGFVHLSIKQLDSLLEIICSNNHAESIIIKDDNFITSKIDNKNSHGMGIKNIKNAVNRLDGDIDIKYTDSLFDVNILIPNYH